MVLTKTCLANVPKLTAEESLVASLRVAYGSGMLKEKDSKQVHAGWRTEAGLETPRPRRATPEDLASIGIGVRTV